jgi:hypothetical protein
MLCQEEDEEEKKKKKKKKKKRKPAGDRNRVRCINDRHEDRDWEDCMI